MAKIGTFFKEVRSETKKISWPSRKETIVSMIAVFVMVIVSSLFLFVSDQVIAAAVNWIMGLGK